MDLSLQEGILVIVSVLLTAACFNVALFFGYGKKKAYLFFAFYCLFHCFKIYLKTFPQDETIFLRLTGYQWVYLSVIFGMLSLSTFLAYYFSQPRKWIFIGSYVLLSLLFFLFIEELAFIKLSLFIAFAQMVYFTIHKKATLWIFIGVLGFILCVWLGWQGVLIYGYFAGVIVLIFFMVLASSIELAKQNREFHDTLLRASRLENQLLKSTIQPHFIANSLTSLQELIDSKPAQASEFVQELSHLFEIFARISSKKLIPIEQEIELVSSYIDIMSIRKTAAFRLDVIGLKEEKYIPPGVLLTLVENGITHGYENRESGSFKIEMDKIENAITYTVYNDSNTTKYGVKQGTGLKYIWSRLKESYGDQFSFKSIPSSDGWTSEIKVWA